MYQAGDLVINHRHQIHKVTNVTWTDAGNYGWFTYRSERIVDGRGGVIKTRPADTASDYRTKKLDAEAIEKMYKDTVEKAAKLRDFLLKELQ
jgi:ribosomal protein L44E